MAGDGRAALEAAEREPPFDLVLMDVQMPEMDGFQVTAAIRARERVTGGHVPIVAMTAHAMKGDAERCLAAGMDGYVPKPIGVEALQAEMDRLLESERPAEPPVATAPLDVAAGLHVADGDTALLAELASDFVNDYPAQLRVLRDALRAGDTPEARLEPS